MSTTERAAIGGAVAPLDTRGPAAGSGAGAFAEAARQLTVCNACRYCEGYCAVYPALELRRALSRGDVTYLANLCHDCRACYYACMYAPPHEFGINIPQALAEVRHAGYQRHARPRAGAGLFAAMPEALAAGAVAAVVVGLALWLVGPARMLTAQRGAGAFYRIVPYWAIVIPGLALCCYWLGVWAAGARVFWRDIEMRGRARMPVPGRAPVAYARASPQPRVLRLSGRHGFHHDRRDRSGPIGAASPVCADERPGHPGHGRRGGDDPRDGGHAHRQGTE